MFLPSAFGSDGCTFNDKNEIMYSYDGYEPALYITNFKTSTSSKIRYNLTTGLSLGMIYAQNELHIIGGWQNGKHTIWNKNYQNDKHVNNYNNREPFKVIHKFTEWEKISHFGLIHIKSQNKLLLIGGGSSSKKVCLDTVYLYNIDSKKWNKCEISNIQ